MQKDQVTGINKKCLFDFILSVLWLFLLAVVNQKSRYPVCSIIPYMIPVIVHTWRYGLPYGFFFAALASTAATPGQFMVDRPDDLLWAGLFTYLKLSGFAFLTLHVKRSAGHKSGNE